MAGPNVKLQFLKMGGALVPFGPDAEAWLAKTKMGQLIEIDVNRPRNWQFLKKFFALINYAFAQWDVPEYGKDFDTFRSDIIILTGSCKKVFGPDGEMKVVAKSISFAKMNEVEFGELYSRTIDVLLANILPTHTTEDVNRILSFL